MSIFFPFKDQNANLKLVTVGASIIQHVPLLAMNEHVNVKTAIKENDVKHQDVKATVKIMHLVASMI